MSGFNIKKAPSEFVIPEDSFESFFNRREHAKYEEVLSEKQSENGVSTIYILPSAFDELNSHINWKKKTGTNLSEQGGILVGNVYKDKDSQLVCGVVRHVIPSTMAGNATYIQFTHDDWIAMYKEFEEKYSPSERDAHHLSVIGWYHTHPNMPVNMSAIDKQTHSSFFPNIHQFSVIINPQRGMWAVFNGAECKNCNGVLFYDKNTVFIEPEPKPDVYENTNEHTESSSMNSFFIKRQPQPMPSSSATRQERSDVTPMRHTPEYSQDNNQRSQQMGNINHYRGASQRYRGKTYYFPFHSTNNSKSYIISDEFVEKLRIVLDDWSLSNSESVSLSYFAKTPYQYLVHDDKRGVSFYSLCDDNNLYAQGFICEKNQSEYLAFHNTSTSYYQDVLLVVLFSETLPDYRVICKKYCDYDCLLWFNSKDTQEFLFFCIEKRISAVQESSNFNIKNRPHTKSSIGESLILFGREIYGNLLSSLSSALNGYVLTETDDVSFQKGEYRISTQLLQKAFERIKRYGIFTEPFSIVIGYSTLVEADRTFMAPQMDKLSNLWFLLSNGRTASFKYLDNDYIYGGVRRYAKFAFVISNYDLDVDSIRSKLFGYTTAFCFNIETQSHRFYRLF